LYLHGVPYALAPPEQTHVPMLMWPSKSAEQRLGIDVACLRGRQDEALSHDNLYHSILGLLGVQTRVYRAESDLFRTCRTPDHWIMQASAEGRAGAPPARPYTYAAQRHSTYKYGSVGRARADRRAHQLRDRGRHRPRVARKPRVSSPSRPARSAF
jgi:hypothetical protein